MDFKYPYTDFHELNLDWFLAEFKKVTESWLQVQQDWADEQQAFQDLHDYVENYFANLDLYQEVHDILWSPAMQGNIQIILSNLTTNMLPSVVADQITAVVASQISTVVALQLPAVVVDKLPDVLPAAVAGEAAAWLAAHVDPDTGYVIDDTLTIAQAAADAKAAGDEIRNLEGAKLTKVTNLYDSERADIQTDGFYDYLTGAFTSNSNYDTSGFIPVKEGHFYRCSTWSTIPTNTQVTFFDSNKVFVSGVSGFNGYVQIPAGCYYINFPINHSSKSLTGSEVDIVFSEGKDVPIANMTYQEENATLNTIKIKDELTDVINNKDLYVMTKTGDATAGIPKKDGTIDTNFPNVHYHLYDISGLTYVYINGTLSISNPYCTIWRMKNGVMQKYSVGYGAQTFNNKPIYAADCDQLMVNPNLTVSRVALVDSNLRDSFNTFESTFDNIGYGQQWKGKKWYAYGTSITAYGGGITTGKYPAYLATMSGMQLTNKGIGGGGIGNLGAYSTGQVYNAICNTTDGKLTADLITLETGANDVNASVPLGTIYDTGQSTLAGCLNDCLRYLQANTNAQIIVTTSPATKTLPNDADQYYKWLKMVREICELNMVHFVNNSTNMGYAKLAGPDGSDYVVDSIHQTDLGGYIMAENLWAQIRNIPVFRTALP